MTASKRHLKVKQQGVVTVVRFDSPAVPDATTVTAIGIELMELVDANQRTRILIDCAGVKFVNSSLLGKLVAVYKKLRMVNGELKLCRVDPAIREILETMHFEELFEILPDEPTALGRFRGAMIG